LVSAGRFVDESSVVKALSSIPRLERRSKSILLSVSEEDSDVYVLYIRPEGLMRIVQAVQRINGEEFTAKVSGVASVCGNCTVRPYVTNQVCISFGCNNSRTYGGVRCDELVVGIPREKARLIMNSFLEMEKVSNSRNP